MTTAVFAIPGDLATRTGGYAYARALLEHLPNCGIAVRHCELPGAFPHPQAADVAEALRLLRATAKDDVLLIDGLAFGALPAGEIAALGRRIVALVHHPLGFETGLSDAARQALIDSERAALAKADAVVVSSDTTRDALTAEFGVAADSITVAEPGTSPATAKRRDASSATVRLLAVGSVVPRKGFEVLVAALAGLRDLDWRLRLVGSLTRSPATARALSGQIAYTGLPDRIDLIGELTAAALLDEEYAAADLFVLSSHYEGYGMVLAEAMAHGLPIITTTGGAAAMTVPDAAALKVPAGDAAALADALARAISDRALREALATASRQAGEALPRWPATAARVAAVLTRTARGARR